ncbi:MAG: glutamate formimidoyltransferase [Candidatus Neomarinimicrobiota bacterium]
MQVVECVPNFSEGRDQRVIRSLAEAISGVGGVRLLHVDSSTDANRTVITFVGKPGSVGEAVFKVICKAAELIDMQRHQGIHPRIGAADVCPFVPLAGASMAECVRLARKVGERVGRELELPVYLYGAAAAGPGRSSLADVRRGEYEGLQERLTDPEWHPDFGPAVFKPRFGAVALGARDILIAFNVNLNTTDPAEANAIAMAIRETGRIKRTEDGGIVRDSEGLAMRRPGTLRACRALGWFIPAYDCAQVSMNLEDFRVTAPHVAFEEVSHQAHQRGLEVTGSELVGMIPLEAMLMAGRYYAEQEDRSSDLPEEELVATAVRAMGLSAVSPFDPEERIIEYRLRREGGRWAALSERLVPYRMQAPSPVEADDRFS